MLNIETAPLPDPALVETQPSPAGPNLPGMEKALFDIALREETEKALTLATLDSPVNAEGAATMALVAAAPAPVTDAPDATPSTGEPERAANPNILWPLPFLALFSEPNRQILPSQGTSAARPAPLEPEPDGVPSLVDPATAPMAESTASPAPINVPVAVFVQAPIAIPSWEPLPAMIETLQPEREIETGATTPETPDRATITNSQQAVPGLKTETPAEAPEFTPEQRSDTEEQVLLRTDAETAATRQGSPEAQSREAALTGVNVFPMDESRPDSASGSAETVPVEDNNQKAHRELPSRMVRRQSRGKASEGSQAADRVSQDRNTPVAEMNLEGTVPSRGIEWKIPATAGNASVNEEGQEKVSPAPEVAGSSDPPRREGSEPSVVSGTNTSQQDTPNPDERRTTPRDLEFEVTARPVRKEHDSHTGRATGEARLESKHSEIQADLRSGGMLHEIKGRTLEPIKAADAPVASQLEQWNQIEKSSVLTQLVEKARSLRWDRNSEIVVSLKPESLGRISMRASLVDRTMVATIAAESDKVRQLIQVELPVIQRTLQEGGIPARVVVSEQSDVTLNYNSSNHGQPRFRQTTPTHSDRDDVTALGPSATLEVADSRYSSHSVHLIA